MSVILHVLFNLKIDPSHSFHCGYHTYFLRVILYKMHVLCYSDSSLLVAVPVLTRPNTGHDPEYVPDPASEILSNSTCCLVTRVRSVGYDPDPSVGLGDLKH